MKKAAITRGIACIGILALTVPNTVAQYDSSAGLEDDSFEWETGEGIHEEEWYDPTDWFNDDSGTVDYEYDSYDIYDPYTYDSTNYDTDYHDEWDYNYDYDYTTDDWGYDWRYDLYADDKDYGRYWNELTEEWDYGYHEDEFEYHTTAWYDIDDQSSARVEQSAFHMIATAPATPASLRTDDESYKKGRQARESSIDPTSWVAVGYDLDGDGRYDSYDMLYGYDLEYARDSSSRRQGSKSKTSKQSVSSKSKRNAELARNQGRSQACPAVYSTSGKIVKTKTVSLAAMDEPHVLADIRTNDGRTARVDMGPKSGITKAGLGEGDQVEVIGTIGKVDESSLLMADRVRHNGKTIGIDRPDDKDLERFEGSVQAMRTVRYKGDSSKSVQAKVDLKNGEVATVDLGPETAIGRFDLSNGDQIHFLADQVRIGGKPALRAEQVRYADQTVKLDRSWDRERYRGKPRGW